MTNLTPFVQNHIMRLFPHEVRGEVTRLLQENCNAAAVHSGNASQEFLERIHCAILKYSGGQMEKPSTQFTLLKIDLNTDKLNL